MHEDILYRKKQQQPRQLILPSKLKPLVYNELHVNMGHLGTDRTTVKFDKRGGCQNKRGGGGGRNFKKSVDIGNE